MTASEEKIKTIKTDPERIQIREFIDIAITTIFHMHEKAEET